MSLSPAYTLYMPGINPDKQSYPMGSRFQMLAVEHTALCYTVASIHHVYHIPLNATSILHANVIIN